MQILNQFIEIYSIKQYNTVFILSVAANGHHGLACRRSAGRHVRHRLANDDIARAFRSAEFPADLEPQGLLRGDGKRPDRATLIPWSRGKHAIWDFTCPDTLAPSHLAQTSLTVGSAAQAAEASKRLKYAGLGSGYSLHPVAIETLGAWGKDGWELVFGSFDGGSEVPGFPPSAPWHCHATGQCSSHSRNSAS